MNVSEIDLAGKVWMDALTKKDIDGILSLYHENAVLRTDSLNVSRGTNKGIRDYFEGRGPGMSPFKNISKVSPIRSSPILFNKVAVVNGRYEFTRDDGSSFRMDCVFTYVKNQNKLSILSQHSSLVHDDFLFV